MSIGVDPTARAKADTLHPAIVVHVAFFAILTFGLAAAGGRVPHAPLLVAANVAIVLVTLAVGVVSRGLHTSRGAVLRMVISFAWVPIAFTELGWIIPALRPRSAEDVLIAADQWLFGCNPTQWVERLANPWASEVLQWVYATFYFIPAVLAARLVARRRFADLDVSLVAVVLGFYSSYVGYFALPAQSPYKILPHSHPVTGVFATDAIRRTLESLENMVFDCFPSGHTEVSLLVLWCAWRFDRVAFAILVGPITLLVISTIYLRYHYGIDLVAALAFAVAVAFATNAIEPRLRRQYGT